MHIVTLYSLLLPLYRLCGEQKLKTQRISFGVPYYIIQVRVAIFQVYSGGTISCKTIIILCGAYNLQNHQMTLQPQY